jgi:hypothetical protein
MMNDATRPTPPRHAANGRQQAYRSFGFKQELLKEISMKKMVRNIILAATVLAGFAGTSYAQLMNNAPEPLPPGVHRG